MSASPTVTTERMSRVDTAWLRMDTEANLMMIIGVWLTEPTLSLQDLRERRFWTRDANLHAHHATRLGANPHLNPINVQRSFSGGLARCSVVMNQNVQR